ncbi:hypothetical protein [Cellulomonas endophytica]|uniref:HD domain-containing protein n=1 Tax=Cellulomonas endophytica TaxID=2494735 RepID=UPI001012A1B7|nr:hypothetical protein [Cellulomonas endophytica]
MGAHDAPAWLLQAYHRSVREAGATAPDDEIREHGRRLLELWSATRRTFHNVRHLADVLCRVDELVQETHEPDLVRLAGWYHGAVFDADHTPTYAQRGGEDEVASARFAQEDLASLGVPAARAARVHDLVAALRRHVVDPNDFDCSVLCDADLAVLASDPQRYKTYLRDVREEYAHVPLEDFLRARLRIVHKLLARPSLFVSPLGVAWEEQARQNLSAEEQRLQKELRSVAPEPVVAARA